MIETREQQLRATLKRLAAIHAAQMSVLDESVAILEAELDALSGAKEPATRNAEPSPESDQPTIDRGVMCVVYRGRRCFLGNTLMLKFLERLVRRPNRYVSHDDLLTDVWNAIREPSSIRSVVKELRVKLRAAGMSGLSDAIDGHVSGHYGLMLDGTR